jgi:hypothetical protein
MTRKRIQPAGTVETAAFLVAMVAIGSSFVALGAYALLSSWGDDVTRVALVFTAVPVGLGMIYIGFGGFAVWVIEARKRKTGRPQGQP